MNVALVNQMAGELQALDYYPHDRHAVTLRLILMMCRTEDEVRWLVDTMTSGIFEKWPGLLELRAVYCSKFTPKDRIVVVSSLYPDGFPHQRAAEHQRLMLQSGPRYPALSPEERAEYSAWAQKVAADVQKFIDSHSMPAPPKTADPAVITSAREQARAALERGDSEGAERILREIYTSGKDASERNLPDQGNSGINEKEPS